jgi:hypothetical protein
LDGPAPTIMPESNAGPILGSARADYFTSSPWRTGPKIGGLDALPEVELAKEVLTVEQRAAEKV